jgi:hypothetical protein
MQTLTNAMSDLADSIVQLRQDRTAARTLRGKEADKLATDVDGFIALQQRHRLDHTAAQRRQLASFMSDLTARVSATRDGFRADLGSLRVALKASADGMHRALDSHRRDRHGAAEAWHATRPAPSAQSPRSTS